MSGPGWIGIGAQRSGTTWFTGLLLQHPELDLGRSGEKEVHFFDRFLTAQPSESERRDYLELFDRPGAGEFTPGYMRWLWVPRLVRETCGEEIAILVLLRDPVERFASAMRWYLDRRRRKQDGGAQGAERAGGAAGAEQAGGAARAEQAGGAARAEQAGGASGATGSRWLKDKGTDAIWGGMYASQLRAWRSAFPRTRFVVEQYERAVRDPQRAVDRVWEGLGLASHPLGADAESQLTPTTTEPEPRFSELHDQLHGAYRAEVDELAAEWGIDVSLWPNFAR